MFRIYTERQLYNRKNSMSHIGENTKFCNFQMRRFHTSLMTLQWFWDPRTVLNGCLFIIVVIVELGYVCSISKTFLRVLPKHSSVICFCSTHAHQGGGSSEVILRALPTSSPSSTTAWAISVSITLENTRGTWPRNRFILLHFWD